jgi:hypothetical protein
MSDGKSPMGAGGTMRHSIRFSHKGRDLEVRALVVAGDWQVWIQESGRISTFIASCHLIRWLI